MQSVLQDFRYGLRVLGKAPGFTAAMIVTLTLGIGANTAIFSYVDATWLRPLPVRGADRLVRIFTSEHDGTGDHPLGPSSYVDYLDLRRQVTAFDGVITYERRGGLLYGPNDTVLIPVDVVSPNYFTMLGANARLGRVFAEQQPAGSTEQTGVVISDRLWRERFGSDPEVVGKQVRLTRFDVTILGVMPQTFWGIDLYEAPAVWLPPAVWAQIGGATEFTARDERRRDILARVRPGVSLAQAQSQVDTIASRLAAEYPESNRDSRFTVVPEMKTRDPNARQQGLILLAIAFAVALIATANVSNLQLARAEIRRRETAMRLALGGGRWRLLRQWLAESLIVTSGGTALAILLGRWMIDVLPTLFAPSGQGEIGGYDFRLDPRVLWFTIAIAGTTAILFGLAPAWQAWRLDIATVLRAGTTGGRERRVVRVRDVLVVTQVTMSLVLLMSAGLLVRTLAHLRALDPGFNPHQNVLLLYVVPQIAHRRASELHSYYDAVQEQLEGLPGVEQVALVQRVPFGPSGGGAEKEIRVPGVQPPPGHSGFRVNFDVVGPGYFSLMQTHIQRGRAFGREDGPGAARVVIVNNTMARRYWGDRDAVGQHLQIGNTDYTIVGVVEDTKWETPTEVPRPLLYLPITQQVSDSLTILLRTRNNPTALIAAARGELGRIDNGVPLLSATTLKEHMEFTLNGERVRAQLTSAFAALGLGLAATGLYGVLGFVVTRRTREIGIRIALGAESLDVLRLMLGYGLRRVLVGALLGVLLTLSLSRAISGLLFGVGPADPVTLVAVLGVLIAVAVASSWAPVRRATQVDPIVALRVE